MFKLFRRRKDNPSIMYGVLQRMNGVVERKQRKAADYLNAKVSVFSVRQLKIGLFIFCLVFGGCSIYVIWQAFHKPTSTVEVKSITIPDHAIIPDRNYPKEGILTEVEISNIKTFQNYLDSLQKSTGGKATYDSIARYRPGLLDSLVFIEQVYSEQLKTSEYGKKK